MRHSGGATALLWAANVKGNSPCLQLICKLIAADRSAVAPLVVPRFPTEKHLLGASVYPFCLNIC